MQNGKITRPIASRLNRNSAGRDFVVGDLHGTYDPLLALLDRVRFDTTRDRLFSVGDLIDRGDQSMECLSLLNEPWFYAVRGNHDDMLLSALSCFDSALHTSADFLYNGGQWAFDLNDEQMDALQGYAETLMRMPYVITVENEQGGVAFNLVHAELKTTSRISILMHNEDEPSRILKDQDIARLNETFSFTVGDPGLDNLNPMQPSSLQACMTWGRRLNRNWRSGILGSAIQLIGPEQGVFTPKNASVKFIASSTPYLDGLSPTFCGHCISPILGVHQSHIFIDRGAYKAFDDLILIEAGPFLQSLP